jgi:hypothetical protein
MTDTIDIRITSSFSNTGVTQATAASKQLIAAQQQLTQAQAAATAAGKSSTAATEQAAAAVAKAEKAVLGEASAMARLQQAQGNAAGGAQTLANAIAQVDQSSTAAVRAQTQLATIEGRVASEATRAAAAEREAAAAAAQMTTAANTTGLQAIPGQLASIVGGAQKVALAFGAVGAAVAVVSPIIDSFADAFKFKAELDATTASINAQLRGIRDTSQVYAEAATFAREFKLTQQETTEAIAASIGVMRTSKAPVEDILGVLARMQVLSPEQSLQEAAIALKALASGDTTSLVTRFEVGRDVANQMKTEIQGGADAVAVMSKFLGDTGIGMDTLAAKTTGAMGAMKDLARAEEDLKLAQAELAQGPGVAITQEWTTVTRGLTRVLGGGGGLAEAIRQIGAEMEINRAKSAAYFAAIDAGKDEVAAQAAAEEAGRQVLVNYANAQAEAARVSGQATNAINLQSPAMIAAGEAGIYQSGAMISAAQSNIQAADAALAAAQADAAHSAGLQATAQASVLSSAAQDEQAVSTELLQAQTYAAADAFMLLHPNISASGVASMAAAGQINPLLAQLLQARIRADEARAALIAFNNVANIKSVNATVAQNRASGRMGRGDSSDMQDQLAGAKAYNEALTQRTLQTGTAAQKQKYYNDQTQIALRYHGQESVEYIQAKTALDAYTASQEKHGRAGGGAGARASGGGGAAAANAVTKAAEQTGAKLADIERNTQQKLLDIDQKYAEQRAQAQRSLAAAIMTSTDDMIAQQEADDLDLIGTKEQDAAKLAAREQAQAKARIANERAVSEAKATAADGDAQQAQDVLKIRQDAIGKQEALDQHYAERQAELAGDSAALDALKGQYDEATAAIAQSESDRVSLTQMAADQRAQAINDEKAKVIAAAEAQLAGVKGASDAQRAAVLDSLSAQASAAGSWANATESASARVISAYEAAARAAASVPSPASIGGGGGGGSTRAAGGLTGITHGPTTLTVGDNPGGMELVSVIPLSGRGTTTIGGSMLRMAGGGTAIAAGDPTTTAHDMEDLLATLLGQMADKKTMIKQLNALKTYLAMVQQAAEIVNAIAAIRIGLAAPKPILHVEDVQKVAADAAMVATVLADSVIPLTKAQNKQLHAATELSKVSAEYVKTLADMRASLADVKGPIDEATIRTMAAEAQLVARILAEAMVLAGRQQRENMAAYAEDVNKSVAILKDMADLRASLAERRGPIDERTIRALAAEAQLVAGIVLSVLVPVSEQLAKDMGTYADSVSHSVGILKDTLDLRSAVKEIGSPISDADIRRIADDALRITRTMRSMLIPTTEEQATAAGTYADAVGKSVSVVKDTLGLTGQMFADYTSPSDAQIRRVVADANRVTRAIAAAARTYDTKGLEAAKQLGDALGSTFSAFKDELLFFEALNSGDVVPNPARLAQFERATGQSIAVTKRLGALAATIPPSHIAALQATTAALTAQAEALIRLSAVPWGDLPSALAGLQQAGGVFARGGGGGGNAAPIVVNIYNPPANLNVPALIQQVQTGITRAAAARR